MARKFNELIDINPVSPHQAAAAIERRTGKRSNPEWKQLTFYVHRATYRRVTDRLRDDEGGPDFSDLMNTLLTMWLGGNVRR